MFPSVRSYLLRSYPHISKPSGARVLTRFFVVILILSLLSWLFSELVAERLPKKGLSYLLYQAHDSIYLWLKSYAYTLFHPWSSVLLLPAVSVVAYLVLCKIFCRPLSRKAHAWCVTRALEFHMLHPIMIQTAPWLVKVAISPGMMIVVADYRRRLKLNELRALPHDRAPESLCTELIRLTRFLIELKTLERGERAVLEAAEWWCQAFFQLRWRRTALPGGKSWKKRWAVFSRKGRDLVLSLLDNPSFALLLEREAEKDAPFSRDALGLDLLMLASCDDPDMEAEFLKNIEAGTVKEALRRRLSRNVPRRREILERLRYHAQATRFPSLSHRNGDTVDQVSLADAGSPDEKRFRGRLSLRLAMEAALVTRHVSIALSYLDTLETLHLVGALSDSEQDWLPLVDGIPAPEDYRIIAELAERDQTDNDRSFKENGFFQDEMVHPSDMDWGWRAVRDLYHRAGPDLAPAKFRGGMRYGP